MATKKFTFDPDSGVAYGANLVINPGADFRQHFEVENLSNGNFDFYTGSAGVGNTWTGTGAMVKSVAIGASYSTPAATFTVGFTSASDGKFIASIGSSDTRKLSEGRYVYDINVSSGATVYRIVSGNVMVNQGISTAL
jgi:hypothetical protein